MPVEPAQKAKKNTLHRRMFVHSDSNHEVGPFLAGELRKPSPHRIRALTCSAVLWSAKYTTDNPCNQIWFCLPVENPAPISQKQQILEVDSHRETLIQAESSRVHDLRADGVTWVKVRTGTLDCATPTRDFDAVKVQIGITLASKARESSGCVHRTTRYEIFQIIHS